jgi:DHA2 family multidrug resistance protein
VPVGIGAVLLCLQSLPADKKKEKVDAPIDWLAIAMLAIGLGSMQTVLEEGNSEDWFNSPMIIVLCVLTVASLCAFVMRELEAENPVVDLRVLRYRSLWAGSLLSIVVGVALYGALFAVPIFAQSVMHYTSEQTGLLLLPGALTSAFTMIVATRFVRKFDPRKVLVIGGLGLVGSLMWVGRLSASTGEPQLFWPLVLRAAATPLMFLPLNLATLGPVSRKDVAAATGFFNLTRQLGGSIGVALLSTILDHRMAFHRSTLVEHVVSGDARTVERLNMFAHVFSARGASEAAAQSGALSMLDGLVQRQASVLSFNDTFFVVALLVLGFMPLVMLLGRPTQGAAPVSGAH